MSKQIVNFVELDELYNILLENKNDLSFDLKCYSSNKDLLDEIEINSNLTNDSTFIVSSLNKDLLNKDFLNKKNSLIIKNFPIEFNKLVNTINVQLIKQRYDFQSKLNIKDYILNLNSRIITKKEQELKLTEREIDIIMFLSNKKKPQKIEVLQNEIWKYSSNLETHTVETHVYRLRKKIKDTFKDEEFIVSYEDGYKI
tara:strand:+ start:2193 stop:2789 length:597 start_codon:yes stop_codon:yes gene_type:complete